MNVPTSNEPTGTMQGNPSPDQRGNRNPKAVLVLLVIIVLFIGISALSVVYRAYQPQVLAWLQVPTLTYTPVPTPPCVRTSLGLGAYIYPLEPLAVGKDGEIPTLGGPAGTAFWISDTFNPYVILYEPAIRNLSLLDLLVPGDQMVIQWADCGKEEFILTDLLPDPADVSSMLEQNAPGIVVIVEAVGTNTGYALRGQPSEPIDPSASNLSQP